MSGYSTGTHAAPSPDIVSGQGDPISYGVAVTPNDGSDLANPCRGIYVGVTGNVKVTLRGGEDVTFVGLAAGVLHGIRATRIWSTGTTATSIVAVR